MTQPVPAPFGSWKSPISAKDVFSNFVRMSSLQFDGNGLYWLEFRPSGRTTLVRRTPDGQISDITPADFDVRTRVHEYGGGAYLAAGAEVYFANFADQHWYRQKPGAAPLLLTQTPGRRFADAVADKRRNRLIAVREDHTTSSHQPVNSLVSIGLDHGDETELVAGNDFYASPRLSPDGKQLTWLTWNHPNMPWDGTELHVAEVLADGSLGSSVKIAGGLTESIFQPEWSPDGTLYFVSDRTGWWNLYRWQTGKVEALHPMQAEFGEPQWVFDMRTYAFASADQIVCTYIQQGLKHLAVLNTRSLEFKKIELPYTEIDDIQADANYAYFIGGAANIPMELVRLDLKTGEKQILRRSREIDIDPSYLSIGQPIEFPTEEGLTAFGFFYPSQNPDYAAPNGELPPLLVMSHGGPTSATSSGFRYGIQYWTTRGIAVLDINYGGSTGYGRAYRERLKGKWGIVDVADCVNGARYLASQGLVDGNRLAITGGSAGGYTTLCALTFHKVFKAGASYYGVSDLEALAQDTHKFESRYLDGLIGPYPERRDLYLERSPIHHVQNISCPMILLQGLDDPVVPPNQAEMMYQAVREQGLPVALITFPGEQHGFRKQENNIRALEAELYFYAKVFKFDLAEDIPPIEIENM